ncbi:GntR family transcriptional regulator [Streptomonospora litoralis]|uniref:Putative HTH-type transcriptional regulator YurK n=1 Tax=Streptomonospora litoralis TaxID=2498135 RepID=A0A4P6PWK9_9ACTN|nr:GntR family transcriptional regulator [Streptomonospora litoralis]QBI52485.1 putative HTH-type transcriptional regulator YurK [Streptomonospora litoralis]
MEPRHIEIAQNLMEEIDQGRYAPGDSLPTEDQLVDTYRTSRNTVRRALQELSSRGRINTKQGSGSTVREYRPTVHLASPVGGQSDDERYASYFERVRREQGVEPREELMVGREAATGALARLLNLDPSEERGFVVIRRCDRFVGPRLWERQESYYPDFIAAGTDLDRPVDIPEGAQKVLTALGYPQTGSWDVVGAKMPSLRQSSRFALGPGVPLLVHERVAYSGTTPIRFTRTHMPADRHQLLYAEGEVSSELIRMATDVNVYDR